MYQILAKIITKFYSQRIGIASIALDKIAAIVALAFFILIVKKVFFSHFFGVGSSSIINCS